MTVSGTMEEQARTAYEKVLCILAAAGFGLEDVTRVTENVTLSGLADYADAVRVRREVFGDHEPSVRTVVVERLVRRAAFLEVELHAVKGGGEVLVSSATSACRPVAGEGFDGIVYLPTILPVDADGDVVHEGDVVAQYALVPRPRGGAARGGRAQPRPRRLRLRLLHAGDPRGPPGTIGGAPRAVRGQRCPPGRRQHPDQPVCTATACWSPSTSPRPGTRRPRSTRAGRTTTTLGLLTRGARPGATLFVSGLSAHRPGRPVA